MSSRNRSSLYISSIVGVGIVGALYYLWAAENKKLLVTNAPQRKTIPVTHPRRSLNWKKELTIEICVSDIQSMRESIAGGCNSIELCCNRLEGGVTPSIGLIEQAVGLIGGRDIALHVLIRPRPGGFEYTDDEFDIIQRDITAAKLAGVDGIVFGALDSNGKIDKSRMKLVRNLSKGMILTFHRAFDVSSDTPEVALEEVIALGCDRLLTSAGPHSDVVQNLATLATLQKQANQRIAIVAAAGITAHTVRRVIQGADVRAVHAGSSVTQKVTMGKTGVFRTSSDDESALSTQDNSPVSVQEKSSRDGFVEIGKDIQTIEAKELVEELVSWTCAKEGLVHALVVQACLAVSDLEEMTRPPESPKLTESSALDSSYVRI